jgi:GT2 family glycosyltransferase
VSAQVAIITRTRNRPVLLERALRSAAAQTFADWRQYVVNDAGDEAAVDAVVHATREASKGRVEVLHLPARVGMEGASNAALERLDARWVVMLDDDDTWAPDFLATMVAAFERSSSPRVRAVVCRTTVVEERLEGRDAVEVRQVPFNDALEAVSLELLCRANQFTNNAFLFERSALDVVGPFDRGLPVYGDLDFNLRFLAAHDVDVVPRALARYHRRVDARGEQANSFQQDPGVAVRARARLTNLWLRGEGGRSPHVGTLLALGPSLEAEAALRERIDKYFNAFHRVRRLPLLRSLEGAIGLAKR